VLVVAIGHTDHDVMGANVHASRMGGNLTHAVKRTGFALGRSDTRTAC
jgi:hypothetical protein